MALVNGATLLARALAQAKIGPVFTLSGNQILSVYEAGLDADLQFVDTRHESAAAHMADAWGRLTGRPGACLVTAGPGHTNALTGVGTAHMAESPMLFLSGGCDVARLGKGGFQEIDQLGVARPLCKEAWMPRTAAEIPMVVANAVRLSLEGVPGPVHITLPFDVLNQQVDEGTVPTPSEADFQPRPSRADDGDVNRAAELLLSAQRPLLLASPSVWRGDNRRRLESLLDAVGMPGYLIESPRGLTDPSLHAISSEFGKADVVIMLAPQDFTMGFAGPGIFPEGTRLIQVAADPAELGKNRPVDIGLAGDACSVLAQLVDAIGARRPASGEWRRSVESTRSTNRDRYAAEERSDTAPIHPIRACAAVRDLLGPGDCLALDGGEFGQWARWALGDGDYRIVGNGKMGGIGGGVPFAIAAKLAFPAANSVAFVGDGTFGFHGMEIDTAVRFGVPMVVVVGNDAGWAAERHRQRQVYGPDRVVAADLLPSRYDLLAQALGGHGELVERPGELRPALERALASGKPAVVNVMIDSVPSPSQSH
jgi:acetolactate synthase-1/2/3 large subunit